MARITKREQRRPPLRPIILKRKDKQSFSSKGVLVSQCRSNSVLVFVSVFMTCQTRNCRWLNLNFLPRMAIIWQVRRQSGCTLIRTRASAEHNAYPQVVFSPAKFLSRPAPESENLAALMLRTLDATDETFRFNRPNPKVI